MRKQEPHSEDVVDDGFTIVKTCVPRGGGQDDGRMHRAQPVRRHCRQGEAAKGRFHYARPETATQPGDMLIVSDHHKAGGGLFPIALSLRRGSLAQSVQREVQAQDIDARLTEEADDAALRVRRDQGGQARLRHAAGGRHAWDLPRGVLRADMRVEP